MTFQDFALGHWLQQKSGSHIQFNFSSSTGPAWSLRDVLALNGMDAADRLLNLTLSYSKTSGGDTLRSSLAAMAAVPTEQVVVLTGAAEALTHVYLAAAEPNSNVVIPFPCYPTHEVVPRALGLEVRSYHLRQSNDFQLDLDEIKALVDERTRLLLVNVPHNPTGATISDEDLVKLHDFAAERQIQFVCDEVHSPIFHGTSTESAARLPHATTIGDFSKAFSLPGLRLGWIIEPDAARRAAYSNIREYATISNSPLAEFVAEIAVRHREALYSKARSTASQNLDVLDAMFSRVADKVRWVRPKAGMTGFPWLCSAEDTRPMCLAAVEQGILLVPGDCMGSPNHFRVGFGGQDDIAPACAALETFLSSWK